jgi:hypothetical protein
MKARKLFTALLALTAVTAVACDDEDEDIDAPPDTQTLSADLTGAAERPTPVTTNATGDAEFVISTSGTTTTITYTVTVSGLSGPITAAHIHGPANASVAANVIVPLSAVTGSGTSFTGSFTTTGNSTIDMATLVTHMLAGNTYINIHTAANPNGEIRGQIID